MNSKAVKTVSCPQCGRPVDWSPANRYRPFCSERCKLIDLGEWATERYRIPDGGGQPPDEHGEEEPR
ncbi:MAG: DNA gyrase inhibitor YacG [Betaproteobacteria bacterium]|nr:MAG: DNA gyrase inhibitor YacG [Betaproteobacteria bacterium]